MKSKKVKFFGIKTLQQRSVLTLVKVTVHTDLPTKAFPFQLTAETTCQKAPSAKFLLHSSTVQDFNMLRKKPIASPFAIKAFIFYKTLNEIIIGLYSTSPKRKKEKNAASV